DWSSDVCSYDLDHLRLARGVDRGARELLDAGNVLEGQPLRQRVRPVHARQQPRRRALVDIQVRDLARDGGHDLDRRGAGADHRHPLAGQIRLVVPARRVEDLAGEVVDALDVRQVRLTQRAHRRDQYVGGELALVRADLPARGLRVPARAGDIAAEQVPVEHLVLLGHRADVGLDLALPGERTRPVRIGREGVRVQMRGHVAGRAGVGVVAPGAADIVAALEHQIIGAPLLLQPDRQAEAGEPAADDDGPDVPGPALSVVGSGSGRGKVGTHVGGSCHDSTRFDGSRYDSIVCNFATHITETRALLSASQQLLSIVQYARGVSTRDRTPKRTRLSPEERRSQLIALGVKMLGERTPEEISISEIAAQAGISRGLLFHYFPTKHDFLLAVVQHANTDLLDRITPAPTVDVLTMLRDSIRRYID